MAQITLLSCYLGSTCQSYLTLPPRADYLGIVPPCKCHFPVVLSCKTIWHPLPIRLAPKGRFGLKIRFSIKGRYTYHIHIHILEDLVCAALKTETTRQLVNADKISTTKNTISFSHQLNTNPPSTKQGRQAGRQTDKQTNALTSSTHTPRQSPSARHPSPQSSQSTSSNAGNPSSPPR